MALTDNCVLYYSLDDADISGTTVTDLSGTGNNGTINGADTGATGILNEALSFVSANSDWLDTNYDPGTTYTISFWFESTNSLASQALSGIRNSSGTAGTREFNLNFNAGEDLTVQYYTNTNGNAGAITYAPGSWTGWNHVVLTRTGNNIELWVNGTSRGTDSTANKYSPTENLVFGRLGEQGIQYLNNDLDEIGVWTRVLSTDEIAELYNSGNGYNPYAVAAGRTQSLALGGGL